MNIKEQLIKAALEHGAYKAAFIDVAEIPFDSSLREYCKANYCGSYGKNYACPPYVGEAEELIQKAKGYQTAMVFQTVTSIEDSFDIEGMAQAAAGHAATAAAINKEVEALGKEYLQLTAGGCNICPVCAQAENKPCRFPGKAISSLEAYCMNVSTLASKCGMKYINGQNTVTYFGAFLFR